MTISESEHVELSHIDGDLDTCLSIFYKDHFPFTQMYEWFSYGDPLSFSRREFSITLANDIYLRFQSYNTEEEMKEKISSQCPRKIDIGAVYSAKPSEKRFQVLSFHPVERELVIDIDLTDYDDVRTCCQGKKICSYCWKFVIVAVKIIDDALKYDFGFKHRLWVYSGRRGVHCWISDHRARILSSSGRKAILSFIELVRGGEEQKKKVYLSSQDGMLHPSIQRSLSHIEPIFTNSMLYEQDIINSEEKQKHFLSLINEEAIRKQLEESWIQCDSGFDRWNAFKTTSIDVQSDKRKRKSTFLKEELMLQYAYPRMDVNVSIQLNHLLKSPFCVHPDTGNQDIIIY